jgi:hypothetical protein
VHHGSYVADFELLLAAIIGLRNQPSIGELPRLIR